MLTPSQVSQSPNVLSMVVPAYSFENQMRWDGTLMAGSSTSNTIQTFDYYGKPSDSKNDNND